MKYQLNLDGRPIRPIRNTWRAAATDAVNLNYGHFVFKGVKLSNGVTIERLKIKS